MGRENFYKPGSFYRVCERTGFCVRAERTRMEWNGLIVRDRSWERRQPQDFVKGVRDDQTVPRALPRTPPTFDGPQQSTLSTLVLKGSRSILVNSPFPFSIGDRIGVMINADLGTMFFCNVVAAGGDFNLDFNSDFSTSPVGVGLRVGLSLPLGGIASSGNLVVNLSSQEITPSSYGASNGG